MMNDTNKFFVSLGLLVIAGFGIAEWLLGGELNLITKNALPHVSVFQNNQVKEGSLPMDMPKSLVNVKVEEASYYVNHHSLLMVLTITNIDSTSVRVDEFYSSSLHFMNAKASKNKKGNPEEFLVKDGLQLSYDSPIKPGEVITLQMGVSDAEREKDPFRDIIDSEDSHINGILVFCDISNKCSQAAIDSPVISIQ